MAAPLQSDVEGLTNAGLQGPYGVVRSGYGSHFESASLGSFVFDGAGGLSGHLITNTPGAKFGERRQVRATVQGTYTVNRGQTGFGVVEAVVKGDDGSSRDLRAELLVVRAEEAGGAKSVQEVCLMEYPVDPATGGIQIIQAHRHPTGGRFSLASLEGIYAGPGIGQGGRTPASAIGMGWARYNGKGGFQAVDIQNVPGPTFGERTRVSYDTPEGRYEINEDGTGMIFAPGGRAHLVVTRARVVGGVNLALAYFFVQHDLHPSTGNLVMTTISRRWG
jgi:hypothetical protein